MKIVIGADHAGLGLKEKIMEAVKGVDFADVGTYSEESCDYPDYITKVALAIRKKEADMGVALCGTGIGASITANKFRGVRAALCTSEFMAEMSRRHNNANILVLGARVTDEELAVKIVKKWLVTPFEGGRHQRRLDKITRIEEEENEKCGRT